MNRELRRAQDRSLQSGKKQKQIAQRKKVADKKKADRKAEKKGAWKTVVQFLKDVRIELKKVIWPGRDEVINYTIVVLVTVTIVATFILVLDLVLSKLLNLIIA
ncbi:MAG: preprotein translocase subunit SecE [Actinomycetota bacterium]